MQFTNFAKKVNCRFTDGKREGGYKRKKINSISANDSVTCRFAWLVGSIGLMLCHNVVLLKYVLDSTRISLTLEGVCCV